MLCSDVQLTENAGKVYIYSKVRTIEIMNTYIKQKFTATYKQITT